MLNGHINGPENLSVLNMYFIEALIRNSWIRTNSWI